MRLTLKQLANATMLPERGICSVFAQILLRVDVAGIDRYWRRDKQYIEPRTWDAARFRNCARAIAAIDHGLAGGGALDAPVFVMREVGGKIHCAILDGKRRFIYMRDNGVKSLDMATTFDGAPLAQKSGVVENYMLELN